MDKSELLRLGKKVVEALRKGESWDGRLKFREFNERTGISKRQIKKTFDSWTEFCIAIGVDSGSTDNLKPNPSVRTEDLLADLVRVAEGRDTVSREEYKAKGKYNPATIARRFATQAGKSDGWNLALEAVGLKPSANFYEETPLEKLASDFLAATNKIGGIPTLTQIANRSKHGEYCFSRKFQGYPTFKLLAIQHLLSTSKTISAEMRVLLEAESVKL